MRNLKRALSLTLASVMLLGMMVVGAGAAGFPDVDENDNVEAIEVLNAVEVILGYDNGDFGPDDLVTRAQMAVIMAKLLNLDYQYYEAACPFTDVPAWARGYVGACYAKGITSGYSATTYGSDDGITPVQAASMMMRALGYFQYAEDYKAGFEVATVSQGTDIGIFNGVGSSATAQMTRDQVAQMALNALRSEMVRFTGTPGVEVNGVIVGYRAEYTPRTSTEAKYNAIEGRTSDVNATNQYYIQLGEELYNGNLKLYNHDTDAFDRPARTWEYKGEEIGTYVKKEMLRQSYSEKITGKTLYDLLTKNTIDTYDFVISVDGVGTTDASAKTILGSAWFDTASMTRTNDKAVGGTGKGVTTEVYVDTNNKVVYIAIINTYLAIAAEDYDEKNDDVDLTVYKINDAGTARNPIYVKANDTEIINVSGEDFDIKDIEKDHILMVNVADGEVQVIMIPEVISDATINAFAKKDWIKTSNEQYDYASTAMYDVKVLDKYDDLNMKELTYNIILDQYGYLIGLERNEDPDQYVFLTGLETGLSNLSSKNVDGNIIRMDGTMETVTIDLSKSKNGEGNALTDGRGTWYTNLSQLNTWCTYSVSASGVYTLKQVKVAGDANPIPGTDLSAAQFAQDVGTYDDSSNGGKAGEKSINTKRVSLNASSAATKQYVYGNDKSVYINVELKKIPANDPTGGNLRWIVDDVQSITTGVKNANLTMKDLVDGLDGYHYPAAEIYTLYDDDGYVIAAVTIGEEDGASSTFAYITSEDVKYEEYGHTSAKANEGKWAWYREAIVNGEKVMLTEGGDNLTMLGKAASQGGMLQGEWYEIKTNSDNEVRKVEKITWTTSAGVDEAKYIREVQDVEKSVNKFDTVLLSDVTTATALRFNGDGTLYTEPTPSQKGFSVSPDVKVFLVTADENRKEFDNVSDTGDYVGYAGLEKALSQMNADATKFNARTVEVNAILKTGSAEIIIINDTNPANSKGTGIQAGGGKYYEYEANIFSNGMARVIVNVTRPEWIQPNKALDYQFDVMVNGKLYDTVTSGSSGYNAVADATTTATTNWSNWAGSWGVPFDQNDTITVENFKWVKLSEQNYKIKYVDQNENELSVGAKATDDLTLDTDQILTYNAAGTVTAFKFNPAKYGAGTGVKYTVLGAHVSGGHVDIVNTTVADPVTNAASMGALKVCAHSGSSVVDLENYVYVKIDTTGLTTVTPTYQVKAGDGLSDAKKAVITSSVNFTGGAKAALSTIGLAGNTDELLITIDKDGSTGEELNERNAVKISAAITETGKTTAPAMAVNYTVVVKTSAGSVTLTGVNDTASVADGSEKYIYMPAGDVTIEDVTVSAGVPLVAKANVTVVDKNTVRVTFNVGVEDANGKKLNTTAGDITFTDAATTADGATAITETIHTAGSNSVTLKFDMDLKDGDKITLKQNKIFNSEDPANVETAGSGDKLAADVDVTFNVDSSGNITIAP